MIVDALMDTQTGLSPAEAEARLARDGPNELPTAAMPNIGRRLVRHAVEPLSIVLLLAAVLSAGVLQHILEGAAIAAIVVLNVVIGAIQEDRADRAVAALGALTAPTARVRRSGATIVIPARELVVGDVVVAAAGDRIPADVELVDARSFAVDEALLTGESLPVSRHTGDRSLAGTLAVRGNAIGVVLATGDDTEIGRIATALTQPTEPPLVGELRRVARTMSIAAIALGALLVPIAAARGTGEDDLGEAVLAGVALAIAAIPEGLAAVVTISLALGARAMASRGAIVRRLPALETLGSTTVICTDKTGTLTTGRVAVTEVVADDLDLLWTGALRCIDAADGTGDPMDVAILEAAKIAGHLPSPGPRTAERPFDSAIRYMSTITVVDGVSVLTVKGAPEVVLGRCQDGDVVANLTAASERMSGEGLRVLAVATSETDDLDADALHSIGVLGFADPLRESAISAVAACRAAGIRIVMVTGDHLATASSVARAAGLDDAPAFTGAMLTAAGDRAPDLLRAAAVIARVEPAQKVELVRVHRSAGEVVAMTGDGVNDAPALRAADIGVALAGDSGTDVAREASGLVVTSGDLGTVVDAIREGRRVYRNVAHVVAYLLTGNLSEILVVIGAIVLLPELAIPLLPVQLLWVNLVTDGVPALALGVDRQADDALAGPPRRADDRLLSVRTFVPLAARAAAIAALVLLAARWAVGRGWEAEAIRSELLLTLLVVHLLLAYVTRARRWSFERGWSRNRTLLAAVGGSLAVQVLMFTTAPGRAALDVVALPPAGWAVTAVAAIAAVALIDVGRLVRRRTAVTNDPSVNPTPVAP